MANPIPQHTPTDGLGTAVRVRMSGAAITQIVGNEYTATLGLIGESSTTIIPVIQDVAGTTYTDTAITTVTTFALTSNVATVTVSATNLNTILSPTAKVNLTLVTNTVVNGIVTVLTVTPSTFTFAFTHADIASGADTGTFINANVPVYTSYNPNIATVTQGGVITAVSPGQAVIEVAYPTFDGSASILTGKIYAEVLTNITSNVPIPGPSFAGLGNFGMLGITAATGSAATSGNAAHVAADVGSRTAISNFPPSIVDSPFVLHTLDDAPTETAITAMLAAYADLAGRTPTTTWPAGNKDLGGLTLTAGIYKAPTTYSITTATNLTLSGSATDVFIFQAGTAMTTGATCQVILSGGVLAKNVYWEMGSAMTIGATNIFQGNILTGTAINIGDTVTVHGRCLAQTAVTLTGNLIVLTLP